MRLNPYLQIHANASRMRYRSKGQQRKGNKNLFLAFLNFYLFLSQGLQLFRLALPVVFHDHHGGVDFAHCQVCGCWENDKLPWKIRPEWDGTLSRGGVWESGRETQTTDKIYNNSQYHAQYSSGWNRRFNVSSQRAEFQNQDREPLQCTAWFGMLRCFCFKLKVL